MQELPLKLSYFETVSFIAKARKALSRKSLGLGTRLAPFLAGHCHVAVANTKVTMRVTIYGREPRPSVKADLEKIVDSFVKRNNHAPEIILPPHASEGESIPLVCRFSNDDWADYAQATFVCANY